MKQKYSYQRLMIILIVISSALGVFLGIANDDWRLYGLGYFTNQSNLLVFIVYLYMLVKPRSLRKTEITILYQAVLAITLTGLVYHVILAPTLEGNDGFSLVNFLVHTLTPLLVVVERILFSKKQVLNKWHPLYWLTFPLLYFIFTLIYSGLGGRFGVGTDYESKFPYFFLNFPEYGVGYFMAVLVITVVLGYGIVYLNTKTLIKTSKTS